MFLITRAARLPGSIVTDLMATAYSEEKKIRPDPGTRQKSACCSQWDSRSETSNLQVYLTRTLRKEKEGKKFTWSEGTDTIGCDVEG